MDFTPDYLSLDKINFQDTIRGLCSLALLGDDMSLRMQAFNIQIVDEWTTNLEYQILSEWFKTERTPPEVAFLNAQSQMWIMSVYEILRTWHQRVREIALLVERGQLQVEIEKLGAMKDMCIMGNGPASCC